MKKEIMNGYWIDVNGNAWFATKKTTYPSGQIDKLHLEGPRGISTWIRLNVLGQPIAGAVSLRYVEIS